MSSFHPESVYIFIKARRLCRSSVIDIYDIVINVNDRPIRCLCDNEGKNKRPSSRHLILLRRAQLFFLLKNSSGTTNIRAPSCFHFLSLINSIQDNGSTERKKSNRVEGRTNFSTLFFFSFPFILFFFFPFQDDKRARGKYYLAGLKTIYYFARFDVCLLFFRDILFVEKKKEKRNSEEARVHGENVGEEKDESYGITICCV